MRITFYYVFDSSLRLFYKGCKLFSHTKHSAGACEP